ncbi:MAG: nitrogenase iron-molybdenum cofactor biosynthesis protein NifN [Sterolibacteriaceae bacterium]|nr:nitrogenase iron-molybdenum cofactor biosynthesis protein NifN [Sterolibacteriaceae bacterium]
MARIIESKKSCTVNPLKMSQPLGASLAFLGMDACMPVMHGSQGCTSFGLVLLVRHFREAIPLQTTAMNEVTTILGGYENIEKAVLNIHKRANPRLIGICSTGLTETKGDDVDGFLRLIREKHPELDSMAIVYVSTPDYAGAFQDGYAKTVTALVQELATPTDVRLANVVNVLPGSHLTPGDIEELREIIEAFDLMPVFLPDHSGSLDGHIPNEFTPTTLGGTPIEAVRNLGNARATLAIGEQMRSAAIEIEMRTGVPYHLFDRLLGLEASDRLIQTLSRIAGVAVPHKCRRQRSQLIDAMMDAHFMIGGKKIAIGAEPDMLYGVGQFLHEMGAQLVACVTTTHSPVLERLNCDEVMIGDLEDLEQRATDCDLLVTHAHGRQAAGRLGIPLHRVGIPCFDRLGNAHDVSVGYRGTRNVAFQIGNIFLAHGHAHRPDEWPLPAASLAAASLGSEATACESGGCACEAA